MYRETHGKTRGEKKNDFFQASTCLDCLLYVLSLSLSLGDTHTPRCQMTKQSVLQGKPAQPPKNLQHTQSFNRLIIRSRSPHMQAHSLQLTILCTTPPKPATHSQSFNRLIIRSRSPHMQAHSLQLTILCTTPPKPATHSQSFNRLIIRSRSPHMQAHSRQLTILSYIVLSKTITPRHNYVNLLSRRPDSNDAELHSTLQKRKKKKKKKKKEHRASSMLEENSAVDAMQEGRQSR